MANSDNQKAAQRKHYANNKSYYLNRNKKRCDLFRAIIAEAKNKPCLDCGYIFPLCVMDFDHRTNKKFNIARVSSIPSKQALLDEIEKCDVVCANCHRIRTFIGESSNLIGQTALTR